MKTPIAFLTLLAAANLFAAEQDKPARPHGPEAARADLKSLKAAEGLEVTLFASEPMLVNPANMDIDARGRIWITEGANYRKWSKPPLRPEGDRIVILEDTNLDGAADTAKTFYQGRDVDSALGICVLGDQVIVSCSPKVMVFTDKNGDDKADGPPKIMFDGIGGVQHDHGVHAFVFGPDGRLYFNMGNDGRQLRKAGGTSYVTDLAGNEVRSEGKPYRQGMVFRCNLDGSRLETLGWNFRNNYEVCVDSFGTLWQSDNDDDGNQSVRINYVMEYGNYGFVDELTGAAWGEAWKKANEKTKLPDSEKPRFHWHMDDPGVVPTLLVTGQGSPTGIAVYEGALLPKSFHNQVIHCDAGPRIVRAYPVAKEGAGYRATMTNLLTGSDTWFRPADVCVAPDGSIYVADWYDSGVGGHNMGDRDLETMRGRVYRLAPPRHKMSVPKLDLSSAESSVKALQSPNMATRYLAWTALHKLGAKAEPALAKLAGSRDPRMRARALQLLVRIEGRENHYLGIALKDPDSDIRVAGLRLAREFNLDLHSVLPALVKDSSAHVRRECALSLRNDPTSEAPALWAKLASQHDGKDRWYLEALGIGMNKQDDKFFNAWRAKYPEAWKTPAGKDIVWRSRATNAPPLLVKLITDKDCPPEDRSRYMRALDFIKGPAKEAALVELITAGVN